MQHLVSIAGSQTRKIYAEHGENLADVLVRAGLAIALPCNGMGRCKSCRVRIDGAAQSSEFDREAFSEEELADGWHLCCKTSVTSDITVYVPQAGAAKILAGSEGLQGELMPDEEAAALCSRPLGAAVDIGTTTVAIALYDLSTGLLLGQGASFNPQRALGADVISRLNFGSTSEGKEKLNRVIVDAINQMTAKVCQDAGRETETVVHIVLTGNTTMMHMVLGEDYSGIARAPFTPGYTQGYDTKAKSLGFRFHEHAKATALGVVGGYVGADILCSVMNSEMDRQDEVCALYDIGTNGEMVIGNKDKLLACATAAGPAFEGGQITFGMTATEGAIDWVDISSYADYTTLGNKPAVGICGSGILDTVAALVRSELVDESGAMADVPLITKHKGQKAFALTPTIFFTQKDVREVQLAKGAIAAGMQSLMQISGTTQVQRAYIAGGFGNYMNLDSACEIGLIPREWRHQVRYIGNGALNGASSILLNRENKERARQLQSKIEYVELSGNDVFMDLFIDNMSFGCD